MSPPWMPFYVGDYLADTIRLSTIEHGAYLLLIIQYWNDGGLPNDDATLARIARLSPKEWGRIRSTIAGFFQDGWKHKRIDAELAKASAISSKRKESAKAMHSKRAANADANAVHLHIQNPANAYTRAYVPQFTQEPREGREGEFDEGQGSWSLAREGRILELSHSQDGEDF